MEMPTGVMARVMEACQAASEALPTPLLHFLYSSSHSSSGALRSYCAVSLGHLCSPWTRHCMIVSIGALEVIDVAEIGRADGSVGAVRVDEMQASVTDPPCLVRRLRDGKALGDGKRMSDVPHRRGRNKHTESQKGGERHSLSLLPPNTTQSFCDVSRRRPH